MRLRFVDDISSIRYKRPHLTGENPFVGRRELQSVRSGSGHANI